MGNPLLKNYNIDKDPFLSGGFNNLWKIYKGSRKDRKQDVCIFVIDKKDLEKYSKEEREEVLNVLKKEAGALVKFKHPSVLSVVDPLLEDKTTLVFATEPVQFTLSSWVGSNSVSKLEIKLMITELCKVISFLHVDAHVIHSSINPDNIFINPQGHVKISGLGFSITDPAIGGAEMKLNSFFPNAMQNLKFTAPELVYDSKAYYQSDIFSIGMIIYNMLKLQKGDTDRELLNVNNNNIDSYKKNFDLIENKLMKIAFDQDDNEVIFKALNKSYSYRLSIKEYSEQTWFNDPKLKALSFVESLEQNETSKNIEFLNKFPNIIQFFENKIIERRFLPAFMNALKTESLIVNTLPAVFSICECNNIKINFEESVWPGLKTLFQMKQIPAAALYFLLSKLQFIAEKISNSEFSSNMMNIICKALDCGVAKIQTVVLDNLLFIIKKVDSLAFKNQIYPRLVNILTNTQSPNLKINILKSFTTVYSLLDQNLINESLLNTIEKVRKADNNSEVCISVVNIYEEIAKVVSVESIANKILPNLISILVSGNISRKHFENIMALVQKYLTRIKESREKDLTDDHTLKDETKDFSSTLNSSSTQKSSNKLNEKDEIGFLDSFFGGGNPTNTTQSASLDSNSFNNFNSSSNSSNQTSTYPHHKPTSSQNNMDMDYISKSLEESSKKSSSFVMPNTTQKKEKTIFDGIKDNSAQSSNIGISGFNFSGLETNKNSSNPIKSSQNTLDNFNFGNLSTSQSGHSGQSSMNIKKPDTNIKNSFPNIDFSNVNTGKKDLNVLDSLLNDLPGTGTGSSNNQGLGMNNLNANNNFGSKINNWDMGYNNHNNPNNYNNSNINQGNKVQNSNDDMYNLDFLKNNKQQTGQQSNGPNLNNLNMGMGTNPQMNPQINPQMNNLGGVNYNYNWAQQGRGLNPQGGNPNDPFSNLTFNNNSSNNTNLNFNMNQGQGQGQGQGQAKQNNNILDGLLKF